MKIYRIANWQKFETYETRKLENLTWVPTPNKHDGLGFRKMSMQLNRCDLFSGWNLIFQVASKTKPKEMRGWLVRDGRGLTPDDLAIMTGFPAQIFTSAFDFFSSPEIGWLILETPKTGDNPALTGNNPAQTGDLGLISQIPHYQSTGGPPAQTGDSPARLLLSAAEGKGRERMEGTEGKGRRSANESPLPLTLSQIDEMSDEQYLSHLETQGAYVGINIRAEFQKMLNWCSLHRKQATRRRFLNWLNRVDRPISGTASPQLQLQAPKPTVFGLTKQIEFIDGEIKKCTEEQIEIGDHVRRVPKQGMEQRVREMRAKVKTLKDQLTKL
jgi:hypothetical protein